MGQQTFLLTEHTTDSISLTDESSGKDYHFTIKLDSVNNNDVIKSYSTKGYYKRQVANLYYNNDNQLLLIQYTRMYGPCSNISNYYKKVMVENNNSEGEERMNIANRFGADLMVVVREDVKNNFKKIIELIS
ncbi:hypothetical protein ABK040_013484 [Willaertia magna]